MLSIITCSADSTRFMKLAATLRTAMRDEPYEIIRIAKARSLAEGYTRGLRQSKGDTLLFCHDDIEILTPDFAPRLTAHMQRFDVVGVAGTSRVVDAAWFAAGVPYLFGQVAHFLPQVNLFHVCIYGTPAPVVGNIQALDGLFLAFRRHVIEQIGWDADTFDGFHGYDLDTTFRAHLAGFNIAVASDLQLLHHSPGNFDQNWNRYAARFKEKFAANLPPFTRRNSVFATVQVPTRELVMEVMTPPHWNTLASSASQNPS